MVILWYRYDKYLVQEVKSRFRYGQAGKYQTNIDYNRYLVSDGFRLTLNPPNRDRVI